MNNLEERTEVEFEARAVEHPSVVINTGNIYLDNKGETTQEYQGLTDGLSDGLGMLREDTFGKGLAEPVRESRKIRYVRIAAAIGFVALLLASPYIINHCI